jgi:hypothetical protein
VPQPFEVLALPGRQRPERQRGRTETRRPEERTAPSKRDSPQQFPLRPYSPRQFPLRPYTGVQDRVLQHVRRVGVLLKLKLRCVCASGSKVEGRLAEKFKRIYASTSRLSATRYGKD